MAITIRDVARLAGVSPSTVSRVLNNKGVISDETSKRIMQAMQDLNYVPNDFARSFATGSPHTIAIVIDVVNTAAYSNYFFNNTVFGIEATAHKNDYSLMITNGSKAFEGSSSIEKFIMSGRIDGIIIPDSIAEPKLLDTLMNLQFPCVILGHRDFDTDEINWVDINNIQAGSLAVRHLYQKGYRKIAFLSDDGKAQFTIDRISGYNRELNKYGITANPDMLIQNLSSLEDGREATLKLFDNTEKPDAILCSSAKVALGALRALQSMNINCPSDCGILSFDNTEISELAETPITSIDIDTFELGVQAAEILIDQIENSDSSMRQTLLSTKIVERKSTQHE